MAATGTTALGREGIGISETSTTSITAIPFPTKRRRRKIVIIPEHEWRSEAIHHSKKIESLLRPGLLPRPSSSTRSSSSSSSSWTALDSTNPIYNFLIEYYGLKGTKGVRRLAQWSPDPELLLPSSSYHHHHHYYYCDESGRWIFSRKNMDDDHDNDHEEEDTLSIAILADPNEEDGTNYINDNERTRKNQHIILSAIEASHGLGGIFLINATMEDLGSILPLRGSIPVLSALECLDDDNIIENTTSPMGERVNDEEEGGGGGGRSNRSSRRLWNGIHQNEKQEIYGVLYNPAVFYNDLRTVPKNIPEDTVNNMNVDADSMQEGRDIHKDDRLHRLQRTKAAYQWYKSILHTTLHSEPVLHCHGLHEWAMLYHPHGSNPPPSAVYQPNLPRRVSQSVINEAVERAGVRCTHVDALRFFAPDAKSLNRYTNLTRADQLHMEQKGCVHAHMDLLKMVLKLNPFVDAKLLRDVLEVALEARRLDVAASPYDPTAYGLRPVPVETREGRRIYRREQKVLMEKADAVRKRLFRAYEVFMELAFDDRMK